MPVKVGNSYVSEAAYEYAKSQTDESATLKSLSEKFPNLKFSIGTKPFNGNIRFRYDNIKHSFLRSM